MNLTISGHHIDVTPAIREYVQNKLERVRRHFDQLIDVSVILSVDNLTEKEKRQKAEINLRMSGKTVFVESVAQDLYAAIDTLIDKLDRQVMKHKDKVQNHNHETIKYLSEAENPASTA
ncbi:ribosome hibernation-promoting factor, HPF/YfiA family [Pseudoduganella umbonata]|jgi:putative sigma-54 modulation protein|uniref:Ribosome hibernation promoting factor n=1 Tax=Pseudoduganella umbonata TaxID=864828 RepID=A0A4P8HWJ3_9BURK|nr:ribosome-associated translation inhibitor RaiA [Pseudoduganella umbonata]MBB3222872.1 putative sigma-54 modulation protein [Pseudoduganella umbonata]QCP13000.1 ribosome-associated translation inhibitor RaiA [Pseudoduganella umbonata]